MPREQCRDGQMNRTHRADFALNSKAVTDPGRVWGRVPESSGGPLSERTTARPRRPHAPACKTFELELTGV
jgi:hypothetical protein